MSECPLCLDPFDETDRNFNPCKCGYQICLWCWHKINSEKTQGQGKCPACRTPYDTTIESQAPDSRLLRVIKEKKKKMRDTKKQSGGGRQPESMEKYRNVRVLQKNLLYVLGLPPSVIRESGKREFFGKHGPIVKVVITSKKGPNDRHSYCAYVTYKRAADAAVAMVALNKISVDGRLIRATYGTTKYCNHFLRNRQCTNVNCLYLHELAKLEDYYTKDDGPEAPPQRQSIHHQHQRSLSEPHHTSHQHQHQQSSQQHRLPTTGPLLPHPSNQRTMSDSGNRRADSTDNSHSSHHEFFSPQASLTPSALSHSISLPTVSLSTSHNINHSPRHSRARAESSDYNTRTIQPPVSRPTNTIGTGLGTGLPPPGLSPPPGMSGIGHPPGLGPPAGLSAPPGFHQSSPSFPSSIHSSSIHQFPPTSSSSSRPPSLPSTFQESDPLFQSRFDFSSFFSQVQAPVSYSPHNMGNSIFGAPLVLQSQPGRSRYSFVESGAESSSGHINQPSNRSNLSSSSSSYISDPSSSASSYTSEYTPPPGLGYSSRLGYS